MNRPPFRVILFIVVLSAFHVAAIAPRKVSAIQQPQDTASQSVAINTAAGTDALLSLTTGAR
jgi:hypothetical protein